MAAQSVLATTLAEPAGIESRRGRALLADDPGLGKTCQSLAYLQAHPEIRPAIIIVPATMKLKWGLEIDSWMTEKCHWEIISGKKPDELKTADIYIINYDIVSNEYAPLKRGEKKRKEIPGTGWIDFIENIRPKAIIVDEADRLKNRDAQRSKAVKKLAENTPHFIALTGTPGNRPEELYNVIQLVEPGLFPSFYKYAQKYCNATLTRYGWDFSGASNVEELHKILTDTIMIRRRKKDVLPDLPAKIRAVIPMELNNADIYTEAETDFVNWLRSVDIKKAERAKKAKALSRIEGLKQLALAGKLNQCIDWIENFIESGEKLVVFTTHKSTISALMETFPKTAVKLDGSTNMTDRQAAVERFQTDPDIRLFVGNIKAAGVGITLTAASNACFLELPWTSGDCDQAEDRIHRIGQDAGSVTIWYLLAENTIDTEIASLLDEKRGVLAAILDGEEIETDNMLTALLDKYNKE